MSRLVGFEQQEMAERMEDPRKGETVHDTGLKISKY